MSLHSQGALFAEARTNLRLAAPLIATQLSFVGINTVDTIMAGRLGGTTLAAVAVGSNGWFLSFIIFLGLFMAVSPIVAQRVGAAREPSETGAFLRNALLLAVALGACWTLLVNLMARPLVGLLDLEAATAEPAIGYLRTLAWAAIPFCLCFVLRNGSEGCGLTKVPLAAGVSGLIVNALANYPLMYGAFGWPGLGAVGAAWGSVVAVNAMLAVYLLAYRKVFRLANLQLFADRPRWNRDQIEIFKLGLPISAAFIAESWLFNLGGLLMARFGESVVAAHQIAINVASMAFMVPLSIGLATTIRVGQHVGAGSMHAAMLSGRAGIGLGVVFALISAATMVLLPSVIVGFYTSADEVAALAVRFLGLAAVFQLFDCVQAVANGALRGFKDTRVPMAVTLLAYWGVGMPVAAGLSLSTPVGPMGVWWGFIAGLSAAAVGLVVRFRQRTHTANRQAIS